MQLFTMLATATEQRMADFNAQELANAAWALATPGQQDAQVFTTLARASEQRMADLNAQDLTNAAWAFATAG